MSLWLLHFVTNLRKYNNWALNRREVLPLFYAIGVKRLTSLCRLAFMGIRNNRHRFYRMVYVSLGIKGTETEPDAPAGSCRNGLVYTGCTMESGTHRDAEIMVKHFADLFRV